VTKNVEGIGKKHKLEEKISLTRQRTKKIEK